MKRLVVAALVLCALLARNDAQALTTVVYPTGNYPADVQNIQAAVDLGGTVLLKMQNTAGVATAFNFGPPVVGPGFVVLHSDIELIGEQLHSTMTTIEGGYVPVRGGFLPIKAAVRGIAFVGPLRHALFFNHFANDIEIIGHRVSHPIGVFLTGIGTFSEAMSVSGGRTVINYNVIEEIDAELGIGIEQCCSTESVEIVGNQVTGVNTIAIESSQNHATVSITDNLAHPGRERYPNYSVGEGIALEGTGSYYVARNDIMLENGNGVGIFAEGGDALTDGPIEGAVIEKNNIAVNAGIVGIFLAGTVNDTYVGQNKIDGTIDFSAIVLSPFTAQDELGSNTIIGNNIARVRSGVADIFLDFLVHDTVVKGSSGSVIDFGTNNRITGFTKGGQPGTGQQVSKAVRLRNQAAQLAARQGLTGP